MKKYLHSIYLRHKKYWTADRFKSLGFALFILILALIIQKFADDYVSALHGIAVGDVLLSHIPVFDLDIFIVQGALIMTFLIIVLALVKPKYLIFLMKALALFVIFRSISISLTHLGVDPHELQFDTHTFGYGLYDAIFNTKNDFFFSGHTGVPFLMACVFWREKFWRYFFLTASFFFAATVLLAHVHYTIDVFAAPFMTYSIYAIAKKVFAKDFADLSEPTETDKVLV